LVVAGSSDIKDDILAMFIGLQFLLDCLRYTGEGRYKEAIFLILYFILH